MKKITIFFSLLCIIAGTDLQAQALPQPSPLAKIEQRVGLTDVVLVYSRPSAKGRVIWGGLVPYGKLWRTGANKATAITFSEDVKVNGEMLPKGEYAIFTIPDKDQWTVIFNKDTDQSGTGKYSEEKDALRVTAKPQKSPAKVETMLFAFDNLKDSQADLVLYWDEVMVPLAITVDTDTRAMANIEAATKDPKSDFRVFNNSANYLLNNDKDAALALTYAKRSVGMEEKFWNVYTLSKAYAANGMYKDAIKAAEKSKKMAEEEEYAPYIKMNEENITSWKKAK